MSVVKSNAYGHDLVQVAQSVQTQVDFFGVDSVEEGVRLREAGIQLPVLILGHIPYLCFSQAIEQDLSFVVSSKEALGQVVEAAKKTKKVAKIHLEIETGLYRQGIFFEDLQHFTTQVKAHSSTLTLEGVMMHFAAVEDEAGQVYSKSQVEKFNRAIEFIESAGLRPFYKHAACSAATVLLPEGNFNLVRAGIGQYGFWSSKDMRSKAMNQDSRSTLIPAMTWKTKVAQVKMVSVGESIGYGMTERVDRNTRLVVLPIGYWDGFDRVGNSSRGFVLIQGKRCKVLGRICMNMCMVDATDVPGMIQPEDEVVILGAQGGEAITAEEMAERSQTIQYEIVTRINPTIPRIFVS